MESLRIFKDERFGEIRWLKINNKDYAVGIDIAKALGYKNPRDAILRHCKGVVKHDIGVVTGATDELLDNPDLLIAAATKLKEERKARLEAENKVKLLEPKGQFYDDVAGSKDSIEVGHVAKVLAIRGIGRNNLFSLLREKKVLDKNNIPYQQFVDLGYFRVLEQKYTVPSGETKINIKTMVFQKGIEFIRRKIGE